MKKTICFVIIIFLFSNIKSIGQSINLSIDSITTLLCKKWEVDYSILGDMKLGKAPGAPEINYEFKKDKTYLVTSDDPKDNTKGTWTHDSKKKLIKLIQNGKSRMSVISLKEDELIMLADTSEAIPDDSMNIKLVFKIKK